MLSPYRTRCRLTHAAAAALTLVVTGGAVAQSSDNRLLGLDVSAWQGNISQTTWNNIRLVENRQFVFIRSSRGGTTGEDHRSGGYPSNDNTFTSLSQRYDDPYFVQNINRATVAGMFAGSYHFSRPDITTNTGADEADHFIQMAGAFMRPGYLPPVHDFEAGDGIRTDSQMAQFALDFSNRIYEVMRIRPAIYINGNYADGILGGGTTTQRSQLAQQATNPPNFANPAYPYLWSARWPNQTDPNSIPVQTANPKDSYTPIYGPWDDYGVTHPWVFWQYASTGRLNSFNGGGSNLDLDVVHGGFEYLKDQLIPAVWWNDASGDWSTLANWNSGQPAIVPTSSPGQLAPIGTQTLPTPRLPGAAGSGPTSGQNDTVILDRPNANITVTLSTGTHNIRKLYVREALNITGGSLTVNYVPVAESTPMSAQFSAPVSISGGASFSVHTLYVDPATTFTAGNASLTFDTLTLFRGATPAKLVLNGTVTIAGLGGATAKIGTSTGASSSGLIDLSGGTRSFSVTDGAAAVDLDVSVPVTNGALTKTGAGTMLLRGNSTYTGATTVNQGKLVVGSTTALGASPALVMGGGATLSLNGFAVSARSLSGGTGTVAFDAASPVTLTVGSDNTSTTYAGAITDGTGVAGAVVKAGTGTLTMTGTANNTGGYRVTGGSLRFSGAVVQPGPNGLTAGVGTTIQYDTNASVAGGFLVGPGTHVVSGNATMTGVTTSGNAPVSVTGPAAFTNFTNGGPLTVTAGPSATVSFTGFTNQGSGSVTVAANGQVNAADFQTYGVTTLAPGLVGAPATQLKNTGTTPLFFNGGSRTDIATPATAGQFAAGIDLNGKDAVVAGGRFVNNGYVMDSSAGAPGRVVADFGALVKGAGFFQNVVVTQNGGQFQAGNSPGQASFGSFTFGPGGVDRYVFAINDAAGAAGPTADSNGQVSGWGFVRTLASATTSGDFNWAADPVHKLTVSLQTLIGPTTPGTDVGGPMANFDPTQAYVWPAVRWDGGYSGPADAAALAEATTFDTSGFLNPVGGAFGWSFDAGGHTLSLTYTPVPEPGTLALAGLAAGGWLAFRRKRPRAGVS